MTISLVYISNSYENLVRFNSAWKGNGSMLVSTGLCLHPGMLKTEIVLKGPLLEILLKVLKNLQLLQDCPSK